MNPVIDPRGGDVEDDASSTKRRSLLSLAGTMLAEISFPKLILSWIMLFVIPALLLGIAPLVASAWVSLANAESSWRNPVASVAGTASKKINCAVRVGVDPHANGSGLRPNAKLERVTPFRRA